MDIEKIIQTIVDNGNVEDMNSLSDILEDTMEIIKEYNPKCFKKYELELYKMAYGNTLSRELADEIIYYMKPTGKRWSIEETSRLQDEYGINVRDVDFYIVMNSAYNDYHDIFGEDIESYIKFSLDFINDEDAKKDKVFLYYTTIPNQERR